MFVLLQHGQMRCENSVKSLGGDNKIRLQNCFLRNYFTEALCYEFVA